MGIVALVAAIAVIFDRLSKIVMVNNVFGIENLTENASAEAVTVIDGILDFNYLGNTGMAFGMFQNNPIILSIITAVVLCVIIYIIYRTKPEMLAEKIAYGMIIGGAVGNVIDRLMHGFVIDFIELKFVDYPIFNVADCFVVLGAVLLCVCIVFFDKKEDEVGKD